jgi:hypothetical protein
MQKLIEEYYQKMQTKDPFFCWNNLNWWQDERYAKVISARGKQGFVIIGYGPNADADVQSEICEIYCKNPNIFMPMIRASVTKLLWPVGFQVLCCNTRAQQCFEAVLPRMGFSFTKKMARDGACDVFKYRIFNAPAIQSLEKQ